MSTPIMQIKPEEINTSEKRAEYTVNIIGCNQTGLLHALLFAKAGFKTVCTGTNAAVISNLAKAKAPALRTEDEKELKNQIKTRRLTTSNDVNKSVSQSDIVVVAVPVRIDAKRKPDYRNLENTAKKTGQSIRRGSVIIVTEPTGINITEGLIKETLENTSGLKVGTDFCLAYSPKDTFYDQTLEKLTNEKRMIAATDKTSLNAASIILETVMKGTVIKTDKLKTAELATIFKGVQEDINIAVTSELALLCQKANIDYFEAQTLIQTDENKTFPTSILLGAETRKTPYILLEDGENMNVKLRMPKIARQVNEEIIKNVAYLVKDALKICGKTLRRARITLLGLSRIPNTKTLPKKVAKKIIRVLEKRGAKVTVYDPYFSQKELTEKQINGSKSLTEALERSDCAMILTGHDQFKRLNFKRLKVIMKSPAAVIDLEGILEPEKIEKADLVYRGLGRGVWTK